MKATVQRRITKAHIAAGGGCIATFRRGAEYHVAVFGGGGVYARGEWAGPSLRAIAGEVVAYCRALGDGWLIASISTPVSIYGDLAGWRRPEQRGHYSYEGQLIGRRNHDILAPELRGRSLVAERRRRKAAP